MFLKSVPRKQRIKRFLLALWSKYIVLSTSNEGLPMVTPTASCEAMPPRWAIAREKVSRSA